MSQRHETLGFAEENTLLWSKRRCALCFAGGKDELTSGSIVVLDEDDDNSPDNLVFLCLDHQARFDRDRLPSSAEIKKARQVLYDTIEAPITRPAASVTSARDFETKVADFVRSSFADHLGEAFTIHQGGSFVGRSGVRYSVDLSVHFEIAGLQFFVLFQIKLRTAGLGVQDVLQFAGMLEDIGATKGGIACNSGFSAGAQQVAKQRTIALLEYPLDGKSVTLWDWGSSPGRLTRR